MDGLPDERVQAALEELLGWPPIARSPQLARFLSYIVSAKLRGEESGIKAYSIAVDVFGRPASFDPQSDPIVRVQARRLRALLDQFYDEGQGRLGVRIHLPVGRYVPEFQPLDPSEAPMEQVDSPGSLAAPRSPAESRWLRPPVLLAVAVAIAAATAGLIFVLGTGQRQPAAPTAVATGPPAIPSVLIGEFRNLTGISGLDGFGGRLGDAVGGMLAPFEDIEIGEAPLPGEALRPYADGTYLIDGLINPAAQGVEVTAVLAGSTGETLWTKSFVLPVPGVREEDMVTALSLAVVREIAPFRGPIHDRGRRWLDGAERPLEAVNDYVCLLTYRAARASGNSRHIADGLACYQRLLAERRDLPAALSAEAWLEMRAAVNLAVPGEDMASLLAEPVAVARQAVSAAPQSSLANEHLGSILNWQNAFAEAQQAFAKALDLNPLNTDARASYAIALSRAGDWELAGRQADRAIADTPFPSPWYFYPAAANAFREGRMDRAIEAGREAAGFGGGEMGTLIALAAAGVSGRREVVDELLPRVMNSETLRRAGIGAWLGMQLTDEAVIDSLVAGLSRAGVPDNALTDAF